MLGRDGKTTVAPAEMPKLAYRCRQIAEDYSDGRLLSRDWKARAEALRVQIDRLCGGRLREARRRLAAVSRRGGSEVVNVLLCEMPLWAGVAQCALYGLDRDIDATNIYSTCRSDPASVLKQISARFGSEDFEPSIVCVQRLASNGRGGAANGGWDSHRGGQAASVAGGPTGRRHAQRASQWADACSKVRSPPFCPHANAPPRPDRAIRWRCAAAACVLRRPERGRLGAPRHRPRQHQSRASSPSSAEGGPPAGWRARPAACDERHGRAERHAAAVPAAGR